MSDRRISIREYARRRGRTHVAVLKALKDGRITLIDGKIDPEQADAQWESNTDPAQQRVNHRRKAADNAGTNGHSPPETHSKPTGTITADSATYAKSRAQRETYLARLAELEYDVKRGKLIDADDVRKRVFNIARTARDILLGVPDRVAPRLAGQSDVREIHRILSDEIARVCNEIADARTV